MDGSLVESGIGPGKWAKEENALELCFSDYSRPCDRRIVKLRLILSPHAELSSDSMTPCTLTELSLSGRWVVISSGPGGVELKNVRLRRGDDEGLLLAQSALRVCEPELWEIFVSIEGGLSIRLRPASSREERLNESGESMGEGKAESEGCDGLLWRCCCGCSSCSPSSTKISGTANCGTEPRRES